MGAGVLALLIGQSPALARVIVKGTVHDGGRGAFVANGDRLSIEDADAQCDGLCTFTLLFASPGCVRCTISGEGPFCRSPDSEEACDVDFGSALCGVNPGVNVTVPQKAGRAGSRRIDVGRVRYVLRCRPSKQCSPTATLPRSAGTELTGDWWLTETASATDCPQDVAAGAASRFSSSPLRLIEQNDTLAACGPSANFPVSFGGTVSADGIVLTSAGGVKGKEGTLRYGAASFVDYARTITGGQTQADGSIQVSEEWTFYPPTFDLGPVVCTRTATAVLTPVRTPCASHADCFASGGPCERCFDGVCSPDVDCPSPYGK